MTTSHRNQRDNIRAKALDLGFDACGFARAQSRAEDRDALRSYINQGRHMDMAWMADTADRRVDPRALWSEAKTVIALGMNYGPGHDPRDLYRHSDRGAVSVYARGKDYHDVVKKRLKALARWIHETFEAEVKVFVDTAPVMEKPLARQAGLGWIGKHTNLVSRDYGSWLFLGEVFTTLELPADRHMPDHCGSCDACVRACPTDALNVPYQMDTGRCLSFLNIEAKTPLPEAFRSLAGSRIYGCDDCLSACPWNKFQKPTNETALLPRAELTAPRLADLAQLDDAGFRKLFAGSPVKRVGRDRFLHNVLIALGNGGDQESRPVIDALLDDPSDLVRDAAGWAKARLPD
ncbi:tRNA epoxyqueuosine(34) reductase QueG [Magnetospira sp. QH-2]|uniref:tRNA epoxyqueuosine(34) reductase QueG n=1 Tax=Magnetospira sp. (strain QH-2) TaxID=1288970 RepID=UPI0003E810D7|nr:tRNA epoxyqueuosine(34) reductase QueG [Magnetospira sp. QH-2]CCQ72355.1 putative iron-sulfur cluster binding protein [Magnetospira sp. QH-2]